MKINVKGKDFTLVTEPETFFYDVSLVFPKDEIAEIEYYMCIKEKWKGSNWIEFAKEKLQDPDLLNIEITLCK